MKKRIEWVDIGKYVCIMFVMLSHLESKTDVLLTFYYPFFLTVFFFLAGYVYKQPENFIEHITKKIKGLLIPWFIFSNFNIFLSSVISFKGERDWKNEFLWNMLQIRPLGDGLWFLVALFVAFIPFYFFIKYIPRIKCISITFVLAVLCSLYSLLMPKDFFSWGNSNLPWHLEYIFYAMLWMVLGYYYHSFYEEILEKYNNNISRIVISVIYLILIYSTSSIEHGYLDLALSYVRNIVGVVFIILICKGMKTNKYISYVGANTLIFFALHGKLYAVMEHFMKAKMSGFYSACLGNVLYSSILAIVLTFIMSIILIVPAYCINKWLPWVVGRKK